jgi:hypothetical protein
MGSGSVIFCVQLTVLSSGARLRPSTARPASGGKLPDFECSGENEADSSGLPSRQACKSLAFARRASAGRYDLTTDR